MKRQQEQEDNGHLPSVNVRLGMLAVSSAIAVGAIGIYCLVLSVSWPVIAGTAVGMMTLYLVYFVGIKKSVWAGTRVLCYMLGMAPLLVLCMGVSALSLIFVFHFPWWVATVVFPLAPVLVFSIWPVPEWSKRFFEETKKSANMDMDRHTLGLFNRPLVPILKRRAGKVGSGATAATVLKAAPAAALGGFLVVRLTMLAGGDWTALVPALGGYVGYCLFMPYLLCQFVFFRFHLRNLEKELGFRFKAGD